MDKIRWPEVFVNRIFCGSNDNTFKRKYVLLVFFPPQIDVEKDRKAQHMYQLLTYFEERTFNKIKYESLYLAILK